MADRETDHHHNPKFTTILKRVYSEFQNSFDNFQTEVTLELDGLTFIGVPMPLKGHLNPKVLRKSIGAMLDINGGFSIVQIVGDSGTGYTSTARAMMKLSIMSAVNSIDLRGRDAVVEYGYTGSNHDINWVVNDVFEMVQGLQPRFIGNIVHQSIQAVDEWGFEASGNVKHFVLAYDKGETKFGDDTWISDSIMDEDERDTLICIEGGPQCFLQVATLAAKMVTVVAVFGGDERIREEDPNYAGPVRKRFSAAYLLSQLKELYELMYSQNEPTQTIKTELKLALTLGLDDFMDKGGTLTSDQHTMIFAGLDKLLEFTHSFRAVVPRRIDS